MPAEQIRGHGECDVMTIMDAHLGALTGVLKQL